METVAAPLATLVREFEQQLPGLPDLAALLARSQALSAAPVNAELTAADHLDHWACDCALAFDQLQTLAQLCAEMLAWHGRLRPPDPPERT